MSRRTIVVLLPQDEAPAPEASPDVELSAVPTAFASPGAAAHVLDTLTDGVAGWDADPSKVPVEALADWHAAVQDGRHRALRHAYCIGRVLRWKRSVAAHGTWEPWLRQNVRFSERTARLYVQIAANIDDPETRLDVRRIVDAGGGLQEVARLIYPSDHLGGPASGGRKRAGSRRSSAAALPDDAIVARTIKVTTRRLDVAQDKERVAAKLVTSIVQHVLDRMEPDKRSAFVQRIVDALNVSAAEGSPGTEAESDAAEDAAFSAPVAVPH